MGLGWCVGRMLYAFGYVNKEKSNGSGRTIGSVFWLFELGLIFTAGLTGFKMLTG